MPIIDFCQFPNWTVHTTPIFHFHVCFYNISFLLSMCKVDVSFNLKLKASFVNIPLHSSHIPSLHESHYFCTFKNAHTHIYIYQMWHVCHFSN